MWQYDRGKEKHDRDVGITGARRNRIVEEDMTGASAHDGGERT